MKVYKEDSPIEIAVQKVEALMQQLGLRIDGGYLSVSFKQPNLLEQNADIMDVESKERMTAFPRFTDSERLVFET